MSYNYLPEGFIRVLEAASLLAFGDQDYETHYSLAEVWVDRGLPRPTPTQIKRGLPSQNVAEINRRRREVIEQAKRSGSYHPELHPEELDNMGREKSWELHYPEMKRELNRLQQLAAAGKISIIALQRNTTTRSVSQQYKSIPAEFFQFNEWTFWGAGDFAVAKPFDPATKNGGTDLAEWLYPAVRRSDVQRLQGEGSKNSNRLGQNRDIPKEAPTPVPKRYKNEEARQHIAEQYPDGIPSGVSDKIIAGELRRKGIEMNDRTVRRARGGK